MNFFQDKDHKELSFYSVYKNKWIVSYDNEIFIKQLYEKFPQITYNLYQSTSNKKGKEIIVFQINLVSKILFLYWILKANNLSPAMARASSRLSIN